MFEIKREARIYKDSIDVFILEDDKKEQACESYENAFTCLSFLLYDVLFFFRLKAFLIAEKRWMSLYIIMKPS